MMLDGEIWHSSEHYFQAQKFIGTPIVDYIRNSSSARVAFERSRDPAISVWIRGDWDDVKRDIMYKTLLAKFTQNEHLRRSLILTGTRKLIEAAPHDSFWGCGADGKGQNELGKLLMEIRGLFQRVIREQTALQRQQQ